jgi:hypothetical protein
MKLYLVDGTYELFRNHFGAPLEKVLVQVTVTGAIWHRKFQYLVARVTRVAPLQTCPQGETFPCSDTK